MQDIIKAEKQSEDEGNFANRLEPVNHLPLYEKVYIFINLLGKLMIVSQVGARNLL